MSNARTYSEDLPPARARQRQAQAQEGLEAPSLHGETSAGHAASPAVALQAVRHAPTGTARPADVLALQRLVGNQAVNRLLAEQARGQSAPLHARRTHGAGTGASGVVCPVQRFVYIPQAKQKPGNWAGLQADLRVSDDGTMALKDDEVFKGGKDFFATPGVIADAQGKLAAVNSPYTVQAGGATLQGAVPGSGGLFKKATPITLTKVVPEDTRKGPTDPARSGDALKTVEACSAHGLDVMGALRETGGTRKAAIGLDPSGKEMQNKGSSLADESDIVAKDRILESIAKRELGLPDDAPDVGRAKRVELYNNLSEKNRTKYARIYGINQFARPEVGEGIEALRAGKPPNPGGFPMHFAPVIARSGEDYVAFENYARSLAERKPGDTSAASSEWYFRMYGSVKGDEDQSYYGQHAAEGSIGDRATSMGLRNQNRP